MMNSSSGKSARLGMSLSLICAVAALACFSLTAHGDDAVTPPTNEPAEAARDIPRLPVQIGDDVLERFTPREPENSEEQLRDEALAWFMTAQVHYSRGEKEEGLKALKKTIEKDTTSLTPFRALIPALLEVGETDEAKKAAIEACKRRPEGISLAQGVALFLARTNRIDEALTLLDESLQHVPESKAFPQYLAVKRQMGAFEHVASRNDKAAEHYGIVFNAIVNPGGRLTPEQVKELLGDAGVTYDEFGQVFLLASKPDLALKAFDEAAKFRTQRPGIHSFNLALLFHQTKKPEESLAELDKYFEAQLQTKGREAYQLLKDVLKELDREEELLPRLEKLAEADSQNSHLIFFLADEYVATGNLDKAREFYLQAPGGTRDPRAVVGLTDIYHRQKDYKELFPVLIQGMQVLPVPEEGEELPAALDPQSRELIVRFQAARKAITSDTEAMNGLVAIAREMQTADPPKLEFLPAYLMGKLSIEADRTDDAMSFYKLAISMQNDPPGQLYQEIGRHLLDKELYTQAIEIFEEAIQHPTLERQRWTFEFFQCGAYEMLGQTEKALEVIRNARKAQPGSALLHYREGWISYHAQRWDEAIRVFEEVISAYAGDPQSKEMVDTARFSLSAIYVHLQEFDKGEKILEDVLKTDPENIQANNDLGYLWADRNKNLDQAKTMIEKALKAEPENPAYLDSMGWLLYRTGEFASAKDYLLKAVEKPRGDDATIWDHLGDVHEKLGEREEAIKAWLTAYEKEVGKPLQDERLMKALKEKIPADRLPAEKEEPVKEAS